MQTYNAVFGTTNNPWDATRTPGGSSGGAAAALAAGFTSLELGSDIGGSIRTPCHWSGVYGHKPTYGHRAACAATFPAPPGTLAETDLGVAGPMARSAEDLELALEILAGPAGRRGGRLAARAAAPRATATCATYRVAAWLDDADFPVDTQVGDVLRATVDALRAAGVRVDETRAPVRALATSSAPISSLL